MDKNKKSLRQRNWAYIVYPDSAPNNWREVINETHVEWAESPLHEYDINPDGSIKKPHWHILVMFPSLKTYEQACELQQLLNCTIPQECKSCKGMIRYFAHLDNPEKYQYKITDIKTYNGLDIDDYLKPTKSERYLIVRDMIRWIDGNDITEFSDFVNYAMEEEFDSWFPLLCDNSALIIKEHIKSRHFKSLNNLCNK